MMRLLLACTLGLFIVGCETALPPLNTVEPTFSYVRQGQDDAAFVKTNDERESSIAIVAE